MPEISAITVVRGTFKIQAPTHVDLVERKSNGKFDLAYDVHERIF